MAGSAPLSGAPIEAARALARAALALAEAAAAARAAPGSEWDLLAADALAPRACALALEGNADDSESALGELVGLAGDAVATLARRAEEDPA